MGTASCSSRSRWVEETSCFFAAVSFSAAVGFLVFAPSLSAAVVPEEVDAGEGLAFLARGIFTPAS